jgi:hypothetical protein
MPGVFPGILPDAFWPLRIRWIADWGLGISDWGFEQEVTKETERERGQILKPLMNAD